MSDVETAPEPGAASDDFEAAFKELSAPKETAEPPADPPAEDPPDDQQQPEPTAPAEPETPPDGGVSASEGPEDEINQALSGLGEEQRKAIEAQLAESRRLQKELDTLRSRRSTDLGRIRALERKLQSTPQVEAPSVAEQQQQQQRREKFEKLRQDYPDIAAAIEEQVTAAREESQGSVREAVAPIIEAEQQRRHESEMAALRAAHPKFEETVNDPKFNDWLSAMPHAVQQLMGSPYAADAKWLLDEYVKATTPAAPPPTPTPPQARRVDPRLQRAIERPRKTAASVPADPDDFDAAFEQFSRNRKR